MNSSQRLIRFGLTYAVLLTLTLFVQQSKAEAALPFFGTVPSEPPQLLNPGLECADANHLSPWTIHRIMGNPEVAFARERYTSGCNSDSWVERLEALDSLTIAAEDIETPPEPGKPFDVALSQQFTATPGIDYSVSGWMVSFCGGTFSSPNDCPDGYYMAKMMGLDPTGSSDPLASTVVWDENRQNFIENGVPIRWVNLRTAVRAEATTMTVFARLHSPFRWHGNHAYWDAISVVRAPIARFRTASKRVTGTATTLTWESEQSPDISGIPGGTYELLVDVESRRLPDGEWKPVLTGAVNTNSVDYNARCGNASYEFRIRARSEQPADLGRGAFPNHRYPGVWSEPLKISFAEAPSAPSTRVESHSPFAGEFQLFLPVVSRQVVCVD